MKKANELKNKFWFNNRKLLIHGHMSRSSHLRCCYDKYCYRNYFIEVSNLSLVTHKRLGREFPSRFNVILFNDEKKLLKLPILA